MSANFNALLNAVVVATNHHVPTTVAAASGAHGAAGQGNAAAVHGAVAHGHGAATVATGNVPAAAGSGNTAQQSAGNQPPIALAPGNGGSAVPNAPIVIAALDAAGQPVSPPGLPTPGAVMLRRTDSTTDWNPLQGNGQFYSARLGGNVDELFAEALSEDQPDSSLPDYPILFPRNLFTTPSAAAAAATSAAAAAANAAPGPATNTDPVMARFGADLVVESADAIGGLTWDDERSEPGERLALPASHAMRPDDYQRIRRYLLNLGSADTLLLAAEAAASVNKGENLRYLLDLRAAQRRLPAWLREHFQMGAEVVLANKDARTRRDNIRPAVEQAASAARDLLRPPAPAPVPSLLGLVVVAAAELLVGAVTGLLKRKRGADGDEEADPEERPAKRARVKQERGPQPLFEHLRHIPVASPPPPRPLQGVLAATNPDALPYIGAAAFPVLYLTSDVATQTGEKPDISAVAGPSRQPLVRTQSQEDAAVISRPRRKLVIIRPTEPSPTPLLTNPGQSTAPLAAGEKRVRFALHTERTRPIRDLEPPRRSMIGEEKEEGEEEEAADADPSQPLPVGFFSKRDWATHKASALRRKAQRSLFGAAPRDPTARHSWSHPHGEFKTYRDAQTQYELPELPPSPPPSPPRFPAHLASPPPSPSPSWASSPSPSREASARKQLRRGSRAGKQVKRRRALKEAATATENDDVKMSDDDA